MAQTESAVVTKEAAVGTEALALATGEAAVVTGELETATIGNTIAAKAAAIAQGILNSVMEANPFALIAIAVVATTAALVAYIGRAGEARREEEKFNDALRDNALLQDHIKNLQTNSELEIAQLKAKNTKESEITKKQADDLREIIKLNNDRILADQKTLDDARLKKQEEANKAVAAATAGSVTVAQDLIPFTDAEIKFQEDINKRAEANAKLREDLNLKNVVTEKTTAEEILQINRDNANAILDTKIAGSKAFFAAERVENAAALAIELRDAGNNEGKIAIAKAESAKKLRAINAEEAAQNAEDQIALQTAALIKIQTETRRVNTQISREETEQQISIINTRTNAEIAALKKQAEQDISFRKEANAQILLLEAQRQQQTEELRRQQLIREVTLLNQNEIAVRAAQLAGIEATNKQRLQLEIENERSQLQIDLLATNLSNDQKFALVAQEKERERQLNNEFIQKQADDEIELDKEVGALRLNELQRQLDAQAQIRAAGSRGSIVALQLGVPKLNLDQQIDAINEITKAQLDANAKQIKANDDQQQTDEEFTKRDAQLTTQRVAIRKNGEKQIQDATKATADFTKSTNEEIFQASLQSAQQIVGFIDQVFQAQEQRQQDALDARRKQTADELAAGAITAKAAAERNKELDAQEKQLQRQQAARQKETALFTAIIQTAAAVATALSAGPIAGIIAAATAAAIGAAQIAVILSTPVPQFYQGKNQPKALNGPQRDGYEGWAELGDRGAELWKSGSQTKLVEKSTVVWVKKNDIIYNAKETATIMKATSFQPAIMNNRIPTIVVNSPSIVFDYKKLAEAVSKRSAVSLNIDGYKDFIQTEKSFTAYLNKRRKWL